MSEPSVSRRDLLCGLVVGAASGAVLDGRVRNHAAATAADALLNAPPGGPFVHPQEKLAKISPRKRQLWPVSYVGNGEGRPFEDDVLRDLDAALEGQADALVLVNEFKLPGVEKTQFSSLADLERVLGIVRKKHPEAVLGVNWLGDDNDPYGFRDGFRLARDFGLKIVWTDFSGVDLIKENPPLDLHAVQAVRPREVFYCSGIHMKYSTLVDATKTHEESALQAMGWIDGIIVTGAKTGVASDPEITRRVRAVVGHYPVGVASGVTAANVATIRDGIDFCLVHTGIQENHHLVGAKVKELRAALDAA